MIKEIIVLLISIVITLGIGIFVGIPIMQNNIMQIQCCNSNPCTDTYYTPEDNKCHSVLCENMPLMDNCTYDGANKSIAAY